MSCGARVRPRWRSSIAITRIPGRTCRCRILRNLLVSLQLIAIPTEEMIGENDTHYLFIRLQLVFMHCFYDIQRVLSRPAFFHCTGILAPIGECLIESFAP